MLVGRFFKVDENSQYSDGTVGFRYLNIFLEKEESGIPKYPIYMTLDSHSINFYFNGYLKTPTDDKDKYIHTEILHLPLSKNLAVKDNLTSVLVNAYDHELLGADKYKNETRRMGYSSLERFKGKEDNICRYLILDFLFDLEHSRVFENSPFYEEVEIRLKENLFFSAIAAVSAYDYNKKMFLYTQDNFPPERKIAAQNFLKAEREWLNCLILDDAEIIISLKKKWFKGIEEELKSIKVSKEKEKKKDGWKERINFFKKKIKEEKENIKKKLKEEKQKFKDKRNEFFGEEVLEKISKIFIRRYHLYGGFNTVILNLPKFFKVMLRIFITFHLLLMLLLIFVSKINIDLLPKLNIFGLLLLLDLIFFFVCLISLLTKRIFLTFLGLFLPNMILAIGSAWLIFSMIEELWKAFFDFDFSKKWWIALLLIPIGFYIALQIKKIAPNLYLKERLCRVIMLVLFAWFISINIGVVFTNLFTPEILERSGYLKNYFLEKVHYDRDMESGERENIRKILSTKNKLEKKIEKFEENEINVPNISEDSLNLIDYLHSKIVIRSIFFELRIYIFTKILVAWSILSLLVGILFEFVAQSRSVTESI